jgi:hypothetical protein
MMSWHTPIHSSQMFADGPAISLWTSLCGLLQNEHLRSLGEVKTASLSLCAIGPDDIPHQHVLCILPPHHIPSP